LSSSVYGAGSGPIWLDDVACIGSETRIQDCSHRGWGTHNCNHNEDVGIRCSPITTATTTAPQSTVRLRGSSSPSEGRLEVYSNGTWGTVCNDAFSSVDAAVACLQLGFVGGAVLSSSVYGAGSGPIWLDDVACNGGETRIQDCSHTGWGTHNCNHNEDVGIRCSPITTTTTTAQSTVLLRGSSSPSEGRLEVYLNGTWGTVCNDAFSNVDAAWCAVNWDLSVELS